MMDYIYDFVSFLFEKKELKKGIKSIILYGSVASGEFDEKSDIDIFIDIWEKKKKDDIEKKVKDQLNKFEEISSRIWTPRGVSNLISLIVGELDSSAWKNLKYDIISNGIILYGKYKKTPEKMKHMVLLSFSTNKLKQTDKMKFIRELYGYEIKKNHKKYSKKGSLEIYGGEKISSNSIIVPIEKIKDFRKIMSRFKLVPRVIEIWVR